MARLVYQVISRSHRPRHHVNVRVISLVMERGIQAEVLRRDVHCRSDVVTVCVKQVAPRPCVVVTEPLRARTRGDVADVSPRAVTVTAAFPALRRPVKWLVSAV